MTLIRQSGGASAARGLWSLVLALGMTLSVGSPTLAAPTPVKKAAAAKAAPAEVAVSVTPIDLVQQPAQYLNKAVRFEGVFNSFSSLGLDYKPAFRDSKDYVGMLVLRPDVGAERTIPMSELKLFYPRKKSDAVQQLDQGDRVMVTGKVFSTALSEPWVEVSDVKILAKSKTAKPKKDGKSGDHPDLNP